MRHLHQAVYAGVCASGAKGVNGLAGCECAQGLFQMVLHGLSIGLALPAVVALTQVADSQGNAPPFRRGFGAQRRSSKALALA